MDDKTIYLQKLCDKLNEAHVRVSGSTVTGETLNTWTTENENIASLHNLPLDNLRKLQLVDYSHFIDYNNVYTHWLYNNLLDFIPYIHEKENVLTIKHNVHLMLKNNQYFMTSETLSSEGQTDRGCFRISEFMSKDTDDRMLYSQSYFANMLCYAALIDIGFIGRNFREWFNSYYSYVKKFMKQALKAYAIDISYTWDNLEQQFIESQSDWQGDAYIDRHLYRLFDGNGGVICEFAYGEKTIQVRTSKGKGHNNILTLNIPNVFDGIENLDSYDINRKVRFKSRLTDVKTKDKQTLKLLLLMMLSLSGIHMNWTDHYEVEKLENIKPSNMYGETVSSLSDLTDIKPDLL